LEKEVAVLINDYFGPDTVYINYEHLANIQRQLELTHREQHYT